MDVALVQLSYVCSSGQPALLCSHGNIAYEHAWECKASDSDVHPRVQGAWKQSHKKQLEGGSNSDSDKPPIPPAEPTLSPKSLRPARRTRKPLKIDNPYDDTALLRSIPPPTSPLASIPSPSPFNSPPDSEDEKDPEPPAPPTIARRGSGGRRGGVSPTITLLFLNDIESMCILVQCAVH